jgi:hypothetical protein
VELRILYVYWILKSLRLLCRKCESRVTRMFSASKKKTYEEECETFRELQNTFLGISLTRAIRYDSAYTNCT